MGMQLVLSLLLRKGCNGSILTLLISEQKWRPGVCFFRFSFLSCPSGSFFLAFIFYIYASISAYRITGGHKMKLVMDLKNSVNFFTPFTFLEIGRGIIINLRARERK